jgi:hypothetical protein
MLTAMMLGIRQRSSHGLIGTPLIVMRISETLAAQMSECACATAVDTAAGEAEARIACGVLAGNASAIIGYERALTCACAHDVGGYGSHSPLRGSTDPDTNCILACVIKEIIDAHGVMHWLGTCCGFSRGTIDAMIVTERKMMRDRCTAIAGTSGSTIGAEHAPVPAHAFDSSCGTLSGLADDGAALACVLDATIGMRLAAHLLGAGGHGHGTLLGAFRGGCVATREYPSDAKFNGDSRATYALVRVGNGEALGVCDGMARAASGEHGSIQALKHVRTPDARGSGERGTLLGGTSGRDHRGDNTHATVSADGELTPAPVHAIGARGCEDGCSLLGWISSSCDVMSDATANVSSSPANVPELRRDGVVDGWHADGVDVCDGSLVSGRAMACRRSSDADGSGGVGTLPASSRDDDGNTTNAPVRRVDLACHGHRLAHAHAPGASSGSGCDAKPGSTDGRIDGTMTLLTYLACSGDGERRVKSVHALEANDRDGAMGTPMRAMFEIGGEHTVVRSSTSGDGSGLPARTPDMIDDDDCAVQCAMADGESCGADGCMRPASDGDGCGLLGGAIISPTHDANSDCVPSHVQLAAGGCGARRGSVSEDCVGSTRGMSTAAADGACEALGGGYDATPHDTVGGDRGHTTRLLWLLLVIIIKGSPARKRPPEASDSGEGSTPRSSADGGANAALGLLMPEGVDVECVRRGTGWHASSLRDGTGVT